MQRLRRLTEVGRLIKQNTKVHNILERTKFDDDIDFGEKWNVKDNYKKDFVFPDESSDSSGF